ncbi:restriction endonuclease subunit S [Dietzia maris]|uniref:restriction endonuclease subunit S n=1 Tax=Dietzia maris TaxID=37915 RepID=UPI0037CAF05B
MIWPAYDTYKSTGQQWLGESPAHWKLRPLGFHFTERKTTVSAADYTPLSVTKAGIVPQLDTAAKTDNPENRKLVTAGDFVINSRSDRKGSAGVSDRDGSVSVISTVLEPRQIEAGFVHHLLRSRAFQEEYYRFGSGIVADLWSTRYSAMKQITLAVPPRSEQCIIARFLDLETAKIDALIEKQEQLIATLLEDRSATISAAITSGIDNNGQLPASRGEENSTPAHWSETKIRHVARLNPSMKRAIEKLADDELVTFVPMDSIGEDGSIDVNRSRPLSEVRSGYSFFERDDVLMAKVTPCFENGKLALAANLPHPCGFATTEVTVLRPTRAVYGQFLCYLLRSQTFRRASIAEMTGAGGLRRVPDNQVRNFGFSRPPLPEQRVIVQFLDDHCLKIDALIEKSIEMIEALHEYRSALITNTVTGKIDVREAV